jgi:hypothetical protein
MSLVKFATAIDEKFPEMPSEYKDFITSYIEAEQKVYTDNKSNGKITFGKYKGYSVKELALTAKGKDYLQWLMSQTFFTEDKFPDLYNQLKELKIKKKATKLAPLE